MCSAGKCALSCQAGLTNCSGTCVNLLTDYYNCGACAAKCKSGQVCASGKCTLSCPGTLTNCSGTCVNLQSDDNNCGACATKCALGQSCGGGKCAKSCGNGKLDPGELCDGILIGPWTCKVLGFDAGTLKCTTSCAALDSTGCTYDAFGSGKDGDLSVKSGTTTINTVRSPASGAAKSTTLAATKITGFASGQRVIVHQSMGTNAGRWEEATVSSVGTAALTLTKALTYSYSSSGNNRAQVVAAPMYKSVTVSGGTLTAPTWDGSTGGVMAFYVSGALNVSGGAVDMSGRGFRGKTIACSYRCKTGYSGQSPSGFGSVTTAANGMGGGAGEKGQDCGCGGGGGHGTTGTKGSDGSCGTCRAHCPIVGGKGGGTGGVADTSATILFGGAGGTGGGDEDGGNPGAGGHGGGLMIIKAKTVAVTGVVRTNGGGGGAGNQSACSGGGSGMGGGGGGAGGGVYMHALAANLGSGKITASGGAGGKCAQGGSKYGGKGGVGRVAVKATTVSGSTSPAYTKLKP